MTIGKFKFDFKITILSRKERLQKKACKIVQKFMRNAYIAGSQHTYLEALMGGIKDSLQDNFNEDNIPTTICFMIDSVLQSSGLDETSSLYQKLKEISK
jgi:hypothetical protein